MLVAPIGEGAGVTPLKAYSEKPVVFLPPEIASLDSTFHSRRDANRVYYAATLKQTRGWARFTSIPYNLCPYNCEYDFRKYGVLVIFYKGQAAGFGAGFEPKIEYIEESPAAICRPGLTSRATGPRLVGTRSPISRIHGASTSW